MFELTPRDTDVKNDEERKGILQKNTLLHTQTSNFAYHDVRYRSRFSRPVIQYMRPEDFQNEKKKRNVTIMTREQLERPEHLPLARPDILTNDQFRQIKSSTVSELVTTVEGENYFQLGWDNCILLQRNAERYQVTGSWRMEEKQPEEAAVQQGEGWMPLDQPVDSLVTWSVSSCEVVILISADKSNIAIMHINNDIPLPAEVLNGIRWDTAFISIIDDEREIQRTNQLLDVLNPANIIVLNRRYASDNNEDHELRYDTAVHGLNYIGLNLSAGQEPQVFGSQGKDMDALEREFAEIMGKATWREAKDILMNYYTLTQYLENFLLSMPHEMREREAVIEESFQRLKKNRGNWKQFYDILKRIFVGKSKEQYFLMNL